MLGTPRFFVIRVDIFKFGRTWSFIQSNIPQLALTTLSHRERFLFGIYIYIYSFFCSGIIWCVC